MSGAELLVLDCDVRVRGNVDEVRGHLLASVPDHDDGVVRGQRLGRRQDVSEQRTPGEGVQDLRSARRRLHPGALAGGEHDDGEGSLTHGGNGTSRVGDGYAGERNEWRAGELGDSDSNRDCKAPKACGLPFTPSPIGTPPA